MCADYTFYVRTIETHVHAFLTLNILAIGRVSIKRLLYVWNFTDKLFFIFTGKNLEISTVKSLVEVAELSRAGS